MAEFSRRNFLKGSAALAGTALLGSLGITASAEENKAAAEPQFKAFQQAASTMLNPQKCEIFTWDMLAVVFTFLFIDMFDTMGTVIGVSQKAGFVDEKGNIQDAEKVFLADSIGTIAGACLGTSTTTTYVESSAGVGAGGRTGLTAFSVAVLFAVALFFSPVFLGIPGAATAPALIIVGMMMMNPVREIDWSNYREAIPAFLTLILMPLAYSISDGILIGVISYVVLYALTGKAKQITPTMWVLAVLFILRYIFI